MDNDVEGGCFEIMENFVLKMANLENLLITNSILGFRVRLHDLPRSLELLTRYLRIPRKFKRWVERLQPNQLIMALFTFSLPQDILSN